MDQPEEKRPDSTQDNTKQQDAIIVSSDGTAIELKKQQPAEVEKSLSENNTATSNNTAMPVAEAKTAAESTAVPVKEPEQPAATSKQAASIQQTAQTNKPDSVGNNMAESKQSQAQAAAPVVIKQSSGKGLALGALVLALLGLGASGFLFVQGQNVLKTQQLSFDQKIDKAAVGESQNANLLQDNLRKQNEVENALHQLSDGQKQNGDKIAAVNKAYQELMKGRANWVVDETEATLGLASQQLLLSGNVPMAVSALENIESRLARFDQPELTPVKQAISSDLAALKNRPYIDTTSASLRLDRLETAVASLPLLLDNTLQPGKNTAQAVDTANLSWWQAAWQKALASLKGVVEVRHLDNHDAMLMAPDQVYFVRENLRLRLLDARTALMQHNGEVYQSDLNSAEAAVKQYFDGKSPATQSWLKELGDLKSLEVRMVSDDALKASMAAVRAYQDNDRATPQAGTVSLDAASAPAAAPAQTSEPKPATASAAVVAPAPAKTPAQIKIAPQSAKPASAPTAMKGDKA